MRKVLIPTKLDKFAATMLSDRGYQVVLDAATPLDEAATFKFNNVEFDTGINVPASDEESAMLNTPRNTRAPSMRKKRRLPKKQAAAPTRMLTSR